MVFFASSCTMLLPSLPAIPTKKRDQAHLTQLLDLALLGFHISQSTQQGNVNHQIQTLLGTDFDSFYRKIILLQTCTIDKLY